MAVIQDCTVLAPPRSQANRRSKWRDGLLDAWRFDQPFTDNAVLSSALGAAPATLDTGTGPGTSALGVTTWGPGVQFNSTNRFTGRFSWSLPTGFPLGMGTSALSDFTVAVLWSANYDNQFGGPHELLRHHNGAFGNDLAWFVSADLSSMTFDWDRQYSQSLAGIDLTKIHRMVCVKQRLAWSTYVNGALVGTVALDSATVTGDDTQAPSLACTSQIGSFLEQRLYSRPWTPGEVAEDAEDPWTLWRRGELMGDFAGDDSSPLVPMAGDGLLWLLRRRRRQHR